MRKNEHVQESDFQWKMGIDAIALSRPWKQTLTAVPYLLCSVLIGKSYAGSLVLSL